ncbi:MAG: selD [Bacteroidetes bacterium]|nr:selD [Bacteroidota bacterium]
MEPIKLTHYSHGSGCGCKIAPDALEKILRSDLKSIPDKNLLVGNSTKDDAAVYDLGNGTALISTVDFFMPVVDDAFDFGRIASANAISDVYAMGGKPLLATALLGWPLDKLPGELAQKVIEGARTVCNEAGISLAGGHSIDALEPMFGLSVNGLVPVKNVKKNSAAKEGDLLYLTKPLGVGILATALKRGVISAAHQEVFIQQLTQLNKIGEKLGDLDYVNALTDGN